MRTYDNYKNSGIEWIGEIPEHWDVTKLKFIGSAIGGLTYNPNNVVEDETKGKLVLRSSNIQNGKLSLIDNVYVDLEISEKLTLKKGDILICSRNGSQHLIGKNICIDERTEGNTFGAFMMVFRSEYYGFLNHFFNSPIFTSQSGLFLTATINQLTSGTLNNFYLAIPKSLEEQTTIANYLDLKTTQIDHLITQKEQLIQLLQEERIAVINQAVTKGLDPTAPMKNSGIEWLGEIPEGWEEARVKNIVNIIGRIGFRGYTTADLVQKGEGAISLSPSNIKNHVLNIYDCTYLTWEKYHESPEIKIFENDIILVKTGSTIGKTSIIPSDTPEMTLNPQLVVFKDIKLNPLFLYYMMISNYFQGYFSIYTAGGSTPAISQEKINNFKITFPDKEEQIKISNFISKKELEIKTIISKTQHEIELLKEYKTALISEVVTGKVDVREGILTSKTLV